VTHARAKSDARADGQKRPVIPAMMFDFEEATQMSAASIAKALPGSVRNGLGFLCRCPVPSHGKGKGDHNPSLSIADGEKGLLVRCFAGCDSRDVLAELRRKGRLEDQREPAKPRRQSRKAPPPPRADSAPDVEALALWRAAEPVKGTRGEIYLRSRGIALELPPTIRFMPAAEYMPRLFFPALIAAVQGPDRRVVAAQLTFLDPQGRGKAKVHCTRKTVGKLGRGAVRLGQAGAHVGLAEGVETALSAVQLFGVPLWACLGASRMKSLWLPPEVERVTIFADRDKPGHDSALQAKARFLMQCSVSVRFPPEGCNDWNDALKYAEAAE
jgi:putative DNA primase/helicase